MQTVTQSCWVAYPPHTVYNVLTDPDKLATIVRRLKSIEVLERNGETGEALATVDLPGGKSFDTYGRVVGDIGRSLTFSASQPVELIIAWTLEEDVRDGHVGTTINYSITVDFSPVAAFVSNIMLKGYLNSEMKRDLETLEDLLAAEFTVA